MVGWEFVARMLDNGLLEQFRSKLRLLHIRECEVVMRMAVRMVEEALDIYPRQPTFVALFLRLFTSSRREKRGTLKTDEFLCTSPRGNVCILLRDFRLKFVPTEGWKATIRLARYFAIFAESPRTMFLDQGCIFITLYINHNEKIIDTLFSNKANVISKYKKPP